MKPLVYYCRWQGASLRLRGRDDSAVWGQLVFRKDGNETTQRFRYNLNNRELILEMADEEDARLVLDDMGVALKD